MISIRVADTRDATSIAFVQFTTSQVAYQTIFPAEMLASQLIARREEAWKEILAESKSVVLVMLAERLEHHHLVGFSRRPVSHQL